MFKSLSPLSFHLDPKDLHAFYKFYYREIIAAIAIYFVVLVLVFIFDPVFYSPEDVKAQFIPRMLLITVGGIVLGSAVFFRENPKHFGIIISFLFIATNIIEIQSTINTQGRHLYSYETYMIYISEHVFQLGVYLITPKVATFGFFLRIMTTFTMAYIYWPESDQTEFALMLGMYGLFCGAIVMYFFAILQIIVRLSLLSFQLSSDVGEKNNPENLLEFILKSSKQTMLIRRNEFISQQPEKSVIQPILDRLDVNSPWPDQVLDVLRNEGYSPVQSKTTRPEQPDAHQFILSSPSGKNISLISAKTPNNTDILLFSDISDTYKIEAMLTASLNDNHIGAMFYSGSGYLLSRRGVELPNISEKTQETLGVFSDTLGIKFVETGTTYTVKIGVQWYDVYYTKHPGFHTITYIDVTDRIKVNAQTQHIQKLSLIGEMASGIAHDYNNYLSVILVNLEMLSLQTQDSNGIDLLTQAMDAVHQAAKISHKLLAIVRNQETQAEIFDIGIMLSQMKPLLSAATGDRINVNIHTALGLNVFISKNDLQTALINLSINTKNATANTEASILIHAFAEGEKIKLRFQDDGPGILPSIQKNIFDPFFTTNKTKYSSGLGLSVIKRFIEDSGGTICLLPSEKGALFEITLPCAKI